IPDASSTGTALEQAGQRLGFCAYGGRQWVGPYADLRRHRDRVLGACDGPKLRKRERFLRRGGLELKRFTAARDIAPRLDAYFTQHIERWQNAKRGSPFTEP